MSNFLPPLNTKRWPLKTAAVAALGAVVFSPLAGCSAPRLKTVPGDIVCSGEQHVPVKQGDTFSELVRDHVNTEGSINPNTEPGQFAHEVSGISFQIGEIAAGRANAGDAFVIGQGRYEVTGLGVTAGDSQLLPVACVEVGPLNKG